MGNAYYAKWVNQQSVGLRKLAKLDQFAVLDPFKLAEQMGVPVISPHEIVGVTQEALDQLLLHDPSSWSAGCLCFGQDAHIIVINDTHAPTRINATLMEELAHIHLGHEPSKITTNQNGLAFRNYNKSSENAAYAVGSTALVSLQMLKKAKRDGVSSKELAELCIVSPALMQMRENVTGIKLS